MKLLAKIIAWFLGGLLLLLTAFYFSSTLQRAVVSGVLRLISPASTVESFSFRWNTLNIKGLVVQLPSGYLNLGSLKLRARFLSAITGNTLEVDSLETQGLELHLLTQTARLSKAEEKAEVKAIELPVIAGTLLSKKLALKLCKIEGAIYFPEGAQLCFNGEAHNIAPTTSGDIRGQIAFFEEEKSRGQAQLSGKLDQGGEGAQAWMGLSGSVAGAGQTGYADFGPAFETLSGKGQWAVKMTPEAVELASLDFSIDNAQGDTVVKIATTGAHSIPLSGDWRRLFETPKTLLTIQSGAFPLAIIGKLIPGITLSGQLAPVNAQLDLEQDGIGLRFSSPINCSQLGFGLGEVLQVKDLSAVLDLSLAYGLPKPHSPLGTLSIHELTGALMQPSGVVWAVVSLPSSVTVTLSEDPHELIAQLKGPCVTASIDQFDLGLLSGFCPSGISVGGTFNTCTLTLVADNSELEMECDPGLGVTGLSLSSKQTPLLQGVDLNAAMTAHWSAKEMAARVDLTVASAQGFIAEVGQGLGAGPAGTATVWLTAQLKANQGAQELKAQLEANVDLVGAKSQPAFANSPLIQSGKIGVSGQASANADLKEIAFKAEVTVDDLMASDQSNPCAAKIHSEGKLDPSGPVALSIPSSLQGPTGVSDFDFELTREHSGTYAASLRSSSIYLDDCLAAAYVFGLTGPQGASNQTAPQAPVAISQTPDTIPFWDTTPYTGFPLFGHFDVTLGRVVQNQTAWLQNLKASMSATLARLALDSCSATLSGGPLKAQMALTFDHKATPAYTLEGEVDFSNMDVASLLKSTALFSSPPIEGTLALQACAQGSGPNRAALLEKVRGKFDLKGAKGHIYLFNAAGIAGTVAQGAFSIVNALNTAAGAALGSKIGRIDTLSRLGTLVQQIDYDTLSVQSERVRNLDCTINVLLQGPALEVVGEGTVQYMKGTPLADQPLNMRTALNAKEDAADLLQSVGLITSSKKDSAGYFPGPVFSVGGTPADPDVSELYTILKQAALGVIAGNSANASLPQGQSQQQPSSTTPSSTTPTGPGSTINQSLSAVVNVLKGLF